MPILNVAGRRVAEDDAFPGLKFFVLHFDLFEVGVAIFAGINSGDLHNLGFVEKLWQEDNRRKMKNRGIFLWTLLSLLSLFPLACKLLLSPQVSPASLIVEAIPMEMDSEKPGQTRLGRLTFLSGFRLKSEDSRFGGLSGLALSPDGSMLYAVSDAGYWVSARMRHDSQGRLTGFDQWTMAPLLTPEGTPVRSPQHDAEALALDRDGSFIVSFEQIHRLWRYPLPTNGFTGPATPLPGPPEIEKAPDNEGMEGLTVLPDGRLFVITERYENADGTVKAWLVDNGRFASLSYLVSDGFVPTDVAALPGGDLLVLERRYSFFSGVAGRVQWISRDALRPGAVLRGKEIASFHPPLLVDNFEGIAVRQDSNGNTLVYIVSDDNYSLFQKTYLLQFRLERDSGNSGG